MRLTGANLSGAQLSSTNLNGAWLIRADVTGADGGNAERTGGVQLPSSRRPAVSAVTSSAGVRARHIYETSPSRARPGSPGSTRAPGLPAAPASAQCYSALQAIPCPRQAPAAATTAGHPSTAGRPGRRGPCTGAERRPSVPRRESGQVRAYPVPLGQLPDRGQSLGSSRACARARTRRVRPVRRTMWSTHHRPPRPVPWVPAAK